MCLRVLARQINSVSHLLAWDLAKVASQIRDFHGHVQLIALSTLAQHRLQHSEQGLVQPADWSACSPHRSPRQWLWPSMLLPVAGFSKKGE